MATANVFLKAARVNKAGEAPVKILLYSDGKKREKSLGVRIRPEQWDEERRRVRKNHPQSTRLNHLITEQRSKLLKLAIEIEQGDSNLENTTIDQLERKGGGADILKLLEAKAREFERKGRFASSDFCRRTIVRLGWFLEFVGKKGLSIGDFKRQIRFPGDEEKILVVDAYLRFLREVRGNSDGTVRNYAKMIRLIINERIRKGMLDSSHKPHFNIPHGKPRMDFLTPEEVTALINLHIEEDSASELARDMYLFSALGTGLRFSDLATLQWSHVEGDRLKKITMKTKTLVQMGLGSIGLEILKKYRRAGERPTDYVFGILGEAQDRLAPRERYEFIQNKNKHLYPYLRKMARKLGVKHSMSFHTARHTFATMAVSKGMKITVLQRILGHSSINETEKYWHILGKDLDEEVEKFNEKIGTFSQPEPATDPVPQAVAVSTPTARPTTSRHPQREMLGFYIRQSIHMQSEILGGLFEAVLLHPNDLDAYTAELALPEAIRRSVPVRLFALSESEATPKQIIALKAFEAFLSGNSLFGKAVAFEVLPVQKGQVQDWTGERIDIG